MAAEYKVLKIDEGLREAADGGIEKYYRHEIKTTGGIRLSIDIAEKDFTAEKAGPILAKKAKEADKILSL